MVLGFKEKKKRNRSSARSRSISMPCSDDDELPIASLIAKIKKQSRGKQTSRKTRSKIRKPKYLSLRLQFSSLDQKSEESTLMESPVNTSTDENSGSKQLELFPVHPGHSLVAEEKEAHDENMAYLFSAADGGASTLTGLLETNTNTYGSCTSDNHNQEATNNNNDSSGGMTLSPSGSLSYAYRGSRQEEENGRDGEVALVRTALRSKERELSEERWVRYSEVVERREDQEVSSCTAVPDTTGRGERHQRLSLKLDYEEILTAWSNKGSLFIHTAASTYAEATVAPPQSPQIVPDIHDDFLVPHFPNGTISNIWGNEPSYIWRVPEFTVSPGLELGHSLVHPKTEEQQEQGVVPAAAESMVGVGGDQWKMEQREASVKRYKEKRQNRLFSKRIRYQVRKLNAEKRPRIKGRFVKI